MQALLGGRYTGQNAKTRANRGYAGLCLKIILRA